jgi:predicted dehydrogenase
LLHLKNGGYIDFSACVAVNAREHPDIVHALTAAGCHVYEDYATMLRDHAGQLDLCCLPTPISCHAPMCLAALEAGANVLVEKPLAATLADAHAIATAEQRTGRFVAVGFQDIYQPENLALKETLLTGALGRIREIRVCAVRPRPLSYYRRNHWAGRIEAQGVPVYDSPVNNAFAHSVNLALFLAGPALGAAARVHDIRAELFRAQPIENFDTAVLQGETDAGAGLKIHTTHSCAAELPLQIRVIGETGSAEWTSGSSIRIKTGKFEEQRMLPHGDTARRRMFERLIARLADPGVFICSTAIATEHVRLVNQLQAGSSIRPIPPEWKESHPAVIAGDEQISIRGIEAAFHDGFLTGKSFQEMHCPWASP